jgi:hypothetical protein
MRAMPNLPEDLEPPRSATAPNRTLSLRTKQVEGHYVRDVEVLAVGWHADPAAPLTYLVFDPREEEDARIYWVRGDFAQQIRHA